MKYAAWILAALGGLVLVGWLGLQVRPARVPALTSSRSSAPVRVVPIPTGLPAPVERWYRADYPQGLPVYDSLAMGGTGVMRIGPLSLPFRHRVEVRPGEGFYRTMDITWFGFRVLRGLDTFVDGKGVMKTPVGPASGPKIDQGANVVSWLEVLASPGTLAEYPGVRWEPIDDDSARLVVPFGEREDSIVIAFDPSTHAPVTAATDRFRANESEAKTHWVAHLDERTEFAGGFKTATVVDAQWDGDERPWATFEYDVAQPNGPVPGFDKAARDGGVRIGDAR